jgi:hypothetical protein
MSRAVLVFAAATGVVMAVVLVVAREGYTPADEAAASDAANAATIFVSVASYRDADCINTIKDLFAKASHPDRVFVGICEQNKTDDGEACVPAAFEWMHHVRRITIPHGEARGPTYARYLCSTLWRDEAYFCQVDSHTRFVRGWDAMCIEDHRACGDDKAVLTHYPHDMAQLDKDPADVPVLCKSAFDANGILTFEAVASVPKEPGRPRPVPFTSGGFVFGPGSMLRDVPYDPDLPHLFQGEEILYSARLWTSGYNFYTPTRNIAFHEYGRGKAPKYWNEIGGFNEGQAATLAKVRGILDGSVKPSTHGLGTVRKLAAYWKFAGVDPAAKTSTSDAKFC